MLDGGYCYQAAEHLQNKCITGTTIPHHPGDAGPGDAGLLLIWIVSAFSVFIETGEKE